ncbi:MAG: GNAT family N-acetyltransferase [Alphaproteobacteria bacterium]
MVDRERLVADLKAGDGNPWSLPIMDRSSRLVGTLRPITYELASDANVVDALYRWRQAHMQAFLTRFTPSPTSTRKYLVSHSLPDSQRVLFLIDDLTGKHVGHVGLCNITAGSVEVDNVIRGEAVGTPDFIVDAQKALLRWTFSELDVPLAYLNVLGGNLPAIRCYTKIGFVTTTTTPLTREEIHGGHRLVPSSEAATGPSEGLLVRMELTRESFNKDFPVRRRIR